MKIADIINCLESFAPPFLQEDYDNAGLLTGNHNRECTGVLTTLDATEAVIAEAIAGKCNLIVAHHPIIFRGLKKINGKNYIERALIAAIKNDIAIYAIHTNLDNVINGVNGKIADQLGLLNRQVLLPRPAVLKKLFTFVPQAYLDQVRDAVFQAGAGNIGNYSEAAFATDGTGSFKPGKVSNPFSGKVGERHYEKEIKIEFIFPAYLQRQIIEALTNTHPYEEVAYDIMELANTHAGTGSGLIGELPEGLDEQVFLAKIKTAFRVPVIRHTALTGRRVVKVALCGGAGSFLIPNALTAGADFFISSDIKYHEFFDADNRLVIADVGHFESEQFTIELLAEILQEKFPNFAVLKTATTTNPVAYFMGNS